MNKIDITELPEKVYCVIDKKTGKRVSQFYVRKADAVNKVKSWACGTEWFEAVSFDLVNKRRFDNETSG